MKEALNLGLNYSLSDMELGSNVSYSLYFALSVQSLSKT